MLYRVRIDGQLYAPITPRPPLDDGRNGPSVEIPCERRSIRPDDELAIRVVCKFIGQRIGERSGFVARIRAEDLIACRQREMLHGTLQDCECGLAISVLGCMLAVRREDAPRT